MAILSRPRAGVKIWVGLPLAMLLFAAASPASAEEPTVSAGEALFQKHCASCHEGGAVARAPETAALRQLPPERIRFALAFGLMNQQGRDLSQSEIGDIARYLAGTSTASSPPLPNSSCREPAPLQRDAALPRWNGWGVDIRQHRFQPAAMAQLAPDDVPRLKLTLGVRLSGRHARAGAADGLGRTDLRRQCRRQGLCARCEDGLPALDVRRRLRRAHRDHDRRG